MIVTGALIAVLERHGYKIAPSHIEPGAGVGTNLLQYKVAYMPDGRWIHYRRSTPLSVEGTGAPALDAHLSTFKESDLSFKGAKK